MQGYRLVGLLLITVNAVGCDFYSKSAFEYWQEANTLTLANRTAEAEKTLQEGLTKFQDDGSLKESLLNLYIATDQWPKAEQYWNISGWSADHSDQIASRLAKHFFESENWVKAYKYFSEQAGLESSEHDPCRNVAVEAYRNAAAAALNGRDQNKIETALEGIQLLKTSNVGCLDETYINQTLDEVSKFLSKL